MYHNICYPALALLCFPVKREHKIKQGSRSPTLSQPEGKKPQPFPGQRDVQPERLGLKDILLSLNTCYQYRSTEHLKLETEQKMWWSWKKKSNRFTVKVAMPTNENDLPTMFQIRGRTFRGVKPPSPPPMLRVIMDKHVIRDCQDMAIHIDCRRHHDLETEERNE